MATDFCCWIPITIMVFINFSGTSVSDIAYVISAIVLLPINSALNPILYSDIIDKLMLILCNRGQKSRPTSSSNGTFETKQTRVSTNNTKCKLVYISHSCQHGYILNSAGNLSTFTFDVEHEFAITHEYVQMSCDNPDNILLF